MMKEERVKACRASIGMAVATENLYLVTAGGDFLLTRYRCCWLWVSCNSAPRDFMLQDPGSRSSPVRIGHSHGRESQGATGNNG